VYVITRSNDVPWLESTTNVVGKEQVDAYGVTFGGCGGDMLGTTGWVFKVQVSTSFDGSVTLIVPMGAFASNWSGLPVQVGVGVGTQAVAALASMSTTVAEQLNSAVDPVILKSDLLKLAVPTLTAFWTRTGVTTPLTGVQSSQPVSWWVVPVYPCTWIGVG
jgi:hypothetical protein